MELWVEFYHLYNNKTKQKKLKTTLKINSKTVLCFLSFSAENYIYMGRWALIFLKERSSQKFKIPAIRSPLRDDFGIYNALTSRNFGQKNISTINSCQNVLPDSGRCDDARALRLGARASCAAGARFLRAGLASVTPSTTLQFLKIIFKLNVPDMSWILIKTWK